MKVTVAVSKEKNPDFVSRQIMKFIGRDFSHILFHYNGYVYHCIEDGVVVESLKHYLIDHELPIEKEIPLRCTKEEFYHWVKIHSKIEYSHWQWGGFALKKLGPWIFKLFCGFFSNGRNFGVCSEFVGWMLHDLAGMTKFGDDELDEFLDPAEIIDAL